MSENQLPMPRRTPWLTLFVCVGLLAAGVATPFFLASPAPVKPPARNDETSQRELASQIKEVCTACHAYPAPTSFPRWAWKAELDQAYGFVNDPASVKSALTPLKAPPY